jgi:ribose-phosphate pyrophosphokinase
MVAKPRKQPLQNRHTCYPRWQSRRNPDHKRIRANSVTVNGSGATMKLISCNANERLAEAIARHLSVDLVDVDVRPFKDNEISINIHENVRGQDVFVIQPTNKPANDNLMELLVMLDALTRASARRVTAVLPYFGYARQDRKTGGRTPITAKLVSNLIATAGANRVLTLDLHAGQIQGFFDIPTDNLFASPVFARDIKERYGSGGDLMVVSPDVGGVVRARELAGRIDASIAIVDKFRPRAGESEVKNVIGDVRGCRCIMIDDIVDSGGTLVNAAEELMNKGATEVAAYITHGVLSDNAVERIENSVLTELVITDSIQQPDEVRASRKIRELTVAKLIADGIDCIANEKSVSRLFR